MSLAGKRRIEPWHVVLSQDPPPPIPDSACVPPQIAYNPVQPGILVAVCVKGGFSRSLLPAHGLQLFALIHAAVFPETRIPQE